MLDSGIRISGSSDAPVESYDALYGIQTATTRAAIDGSPQGGWLPTEKLSVEEALRLYTETPAYSVFMEEKIGKIKRRLQGRPDHFRSKPIGNSTGINLSNQRCEDVL